MTAPQFTLPLSYKLLTAVNVASSTDKTRHYLQGVHLEVTPGRIVYTATDGHILLTASEDTKHEVDRFSAIIPRAAIDQLKIPAKNGYGDVTLTSRGGNKFTLDSKKTGVGIQGSFIDGSFPDWRRIVALVDAPPRPDDKFVYTIVPRLLSRLGEAGKIVGAATPVFRPSGNNPWPVAFPSAPSIYGVVMPERWLVSSVDFNLPAWARA